MAHDQKLSQPFDLAAFNEITAHYSGKINFLKTNHVTVRSEILRSFRITFETPLENQ